MRDKIRNNEKSDGPVDCEDPGAPAELRIAGKTREEVEAMIDAGFAGGPPTPMSDEDWRWLHERIEQRTEAQPSREAASN